jgi:hypothetical protein
MHFSLTPFLAILVVVAFWRRSVAVQEDPALHLGSAHASTAAQQVAVAKKLEQIDKWVKLLIVIAVVFGVLLAAAALYKAWVLGPSAGL